MTVGRRVARHHSAGGGSSGPPVTVDGVEYLEGVDVAWLKETKNEHGEVTSSEWIEGTVELEHWEVVELTEITVVKGPPLAPGSGWGRRRRPWPAG